MDEVYSWFTEELTVSWDNSKQWMNKKTECVLTEPAADFTMLHAHLLRVYRILEGGVSSAIR